MLPVALLPVVLPAIVLPLVVWLPCIIVCADADKVLKFSASITPITNTTATIVTPNLKASFMPPYIRLSIYLKIVTRTLVLEVSFFLLKVILAESLNKYRYLKLITSDISIFDCKPSK
jgi:hypothetical protein